MFMSKNEEGVPRDLIEELKSENISLTRVDVLLSDLSGRMNSNLSSKLLLLISDEMDDKAVFLIVHAAESIDDAQYVAGLLSAFAELMLSAPRWASIVLMRVLNSEAARSELIRQLRNSAVSVRSSVREMCERINAVSPVFLKKTVAVILAASVT